MRLDERFDFRRPVTVLAAIRPGSRQNYVTVYQCKTCKAMVPECDRQDTTEHHMWHEAQEAE